MYCKSAWSNDGTTDRIDRGSTVNRNSLTHERCPTQSHIHTQYSAERIASPYQAAFTVGIGYRYRFGICRIMNSAEYPLAAEVRIFSGAKVFSKVGHQFILTNFGGE